MILNLVLFGLSFEEVLNKMTLKQCIALYEYSIAKEKLKNKIFTELNFLSNIATMSKEGFQKMKEYLEDELDNKEVEVL